MSASSFTRFAMHELALKKSRSEPIAMISLYDAPTATLCCDAGADVLLVGDSLGNVVLGLDSTVGVTMDDMVRHTGAVVRGVARSTRPGVPVVADLPFGAYHGSADSIVQNGAALIRAGATALKIEGGNDIVLHAIELFVAMGAPVVGHLGFTPQSALNFSRVVQGRQSDSAHQLQHDAKRLQDAGCAMIVLEAVAAEVAQTVASNCSIPIIGIGAGACDGQVLVWHDLAGLLPAKPPRFVQQFAQLHNPLQQAAADYVQAVHQKNFPQPEHTWSMPDEERHCWRSDSSD